MLFKHSWLQDLTFPDSKMTKELDLILFCSYYNVSEFCNSNMRLHLSRFQDDERFGFYFVHRTRCLDIWGSWPSARGQEFQEQWNHFIQIQKHRYKYRNANTITEIHTVIQTHKYKCITTLTFWGKVSAGYSTFKSKYKRTRLFR